MPLFGEELRSERIRRGVSLERISAETKVSVRYLQALEQGDLTVLPGGIFRKGILHAYLLGVGLEEQPWMDRFRQLTAELSPPAPATAQPGEEPGAAWETFAQSILRNRAPRKQTADARWVGVAALFLVLLVAAWAVWNFVLKVRLVA